MSKLVFFGLIKCLILITLSFKCFGANSKLIHEKASFSKDSILIFKTEKMQVIKFDSNRNPLSKTTKGINYHIINFDTGEIIFLFQRNGKTEWSNQTFPFYSTLASNENIEFETSSDISRKIFLDINPFSSLVYSYNDGITLNFEGLIRIEKEDFDKLEIYEWKNLQEPIEYHKEIVINERIENFEYSEHWRQESFKKAIDFLQQKLDKSNPKCKMISRSPYNTNLVRFIGNQGLRVKLLVEYDCNQDYINQSYFWINAYYLGFGKWSLDLEDQKLTH